DLVDQRLAVSFATKIRIDRQRGELADLFRWECVERGTADNDSVVLGDHEALDFHLQALARTPDEHALVLQRSDDRQNSSHVAYGRAPNLRQQRGRVHGYGAMEG